ncbi:LOG family protein [Rhodopseudomonas sp. P2A-2r]|uniref:LOG family protein n=1 Tax=Rhodopseudomonas sp. RCAM05734 TaxID=3457549 RepID=UPI0022342852|nr:LOG family protein [Rhodopseudomonas sp. P2A-2r]
MLFALPSAAPYPKTESHFKGIGHCGFSARVSVIKIATKPNLKADLTLCFSFHYCALRKLHFLLRAKTLVAFPSGYGTFDELFEVLTLIQTRNIKANSRCAGEQSLLTSCRRHRVPGR